MYTFFNIYTLADTQTDAHIDIYSTGINGKGIRMAEKKRNEKEEDVYGVKFS